MKCEKDRKYSIEVTAEELANIFTGVWLDFMTRAVGETNAKRLMQNAVKTLVVYCLESGKVTGEDFSKLGSEMIRLGTNPIRVQAGNRSYDERYQELLDIIEDLALAQEE